MQQLSCVVHGGYPLPTLSWLRNGIPLTESPSVRITWSGFHHTNLNTGASISPVDTMMVPPLHPSWNNRTTSLHHLNNHPTSELVLHLQPEDDGAEYTCTAQNSAMSQPLQASVHLAVHCKYFSCYLIYSFAFLSALVDFLMRSLHTTFFVPLVMSSRQ